MTSRNPRPPLLFNFSIWGHFRYFKQFLAHLLSFDLRSPLCQLMWATRSRLIQIEQIRIYLNKNTESQMRKQVIEHHHDSNQAFFSQDKSSLTEVVVLTCLIIWVHPFRVCTFWAAKIEDSSFNFSNLSLDFEPNKYCPENSCFGQEWNKKTYQYLLLRPVKPFVRLDPKWF